MWGHPVFPTTGICDVIAAWLVCLAIATGCLGLATIAGIS
jgi:hypothetical protein